MDNLRHKLRTVIFMRFRPGANKHAAKGAGNQHELIYSYGIASEWSSAAKERSEAPQAAGKQVKVSDF